MSTAAVPLAKAELYHHERYDCYECMGCRQMLEVPRVAVLHAGQGPVRIKENPENRMLWLEMQALDHGKCAQYQDAGKAEAARKFRRAPLVVVQGGKAQTPFGAKLAALRVLGG